MNKNICVFTICSAGHINQSVVSLNSARKNISNNYKVNLNIFCIDEVDENLKSKIKTNFDIEVLTLDSIVDENVQKSILKYKKYKDILRWSNKSNLLLYLVEKYETVFYIDNDIYFVNNCDELIEQTGKGVLLTPHNRGPKPGVCQFECLFTDGFFNAGFIGANRLGKDALKWWSDCVLWNCSKDFQKGIFNDQKYLDIMSLEFNDVVSICKNKGCNIATWNIGNINYKNIKPIFFHFSYLNVNHNNILIETYHKFKKETESL